MPRPAGGRLARVAGMISAATHSRSRTQMKSEALFLLSCFICGLEHYLSPFLLLWLPLTGDSPVTQVLPEAAASLSEGGQISSCWHVNGR